MKPKHLSLAIAALLAAGGLWFAWSACTHPFHESSMGVAFKKPDEQGLPRAAQPQTDEDASMGMSQTQESRRGNSPNPGQMLRPPEPNRRFKDFTPEQRVEFARKGHGPGG